MEQEQERFPEETNKLLKCKDKGSRLEGTVRIMKIKSKVGSNWTKDKRRRLKRKI